MAKDDGKDAYLATIDSLLTEALGPREGRIAQAALDKFADYDADKRLDRYNLADMYYEGRERTELTDRLKQYLETNTGVYYVENFCKAIADAYSERLVITGITTSEDEPPPPPPTDPETGLPTGDDPPEKPMDLAAWLWNRVWDGSQGDQTSIEVHRDASRRGDGFLIVDYDTEKLRPVLARQIPEQIRIVYENGRKKVAVKKWYTSDVSPTNPAGRKICRMNLYYPDHIEKWFRLHKEGGGQGGWYEWLDEGDETWPIDWKAKDGKPLGIPVFHFANDGDDTGYGVARHRIVIPLQDRLNKECIDLSSVLDQEGYPQRWAVGVENTDGLKSDPGTVWSTAVAEGKFGQFEAADPAGPLSSIESTITRMSTLSRTPRYMLELSGGTPSGEALKTAESGLVSDIAGDQPFYGNQWAESLRMSAMVAITYGGNAKDEQPPVDIAAVRAASININWKDPRTFDEKAHLESLQIMQTLGIPEEYLWSRMEGIDVDAVKQLKKQSDADNAAMMVNMFNRGGDTNPAEPGQGVPPPNTGPNGGPPGLPGRPS